MKGNYFGTGVYRQIPGASFWENPEARRNYQNDLAISRGYVPQGMTRIPKRPNLRINSITSSKSHLGRNLLIAGALTLSLAAGTAYAEDSHGFWDNYLSFQILNIPEPPLNLIEMVAITRATAETVHNEAGSQLSEVSSQNVSWIDPMPGNSRIGRPDYDNPSKYELNKIVLELGSSARQVYTKTQNSLQASLIIRNNSPGKIDMNYASVYAEGFGKPEVRLDGCQDSIYPEKECEYRWELPLSISPTYRVVNLTASYGYSAEILTKLSSLKYGPLELSKHSDSEDVRTKVGKVIYTIDIYNRGKGKMTVNSIKGIDLQGQDYNIDSNATGTYLSGEKRSFNLTASKSEATEWQNGLRKLNIEFTYEDAFAREIEINPN